MSLIAITGWRTAVPATVLATISASTSMYHCCDVVPQFEELPLLFILVLLM